METVAAACALCLGILYLLVLAPLSAPDEVSHFISAYRLSNEMLGQPAAERQRLEICTLLAYEDLPCLTVEAAGLHFHFQIPPEAQARLTQYL